VPDDPFARAADLILVAGLFGLNALVALGGLPVLLRSFG
jgi:hypothetical protein